jgi:hypothetical protein
MYTCERCGSQVAPRIPAQRVVLAWRAKRYPTRAYPVKLAGRTRTAHDYGGGGYEIAKGALACPDCARSHVPPTLPLRERAAHERRFISEA